MPTRPHESNTGDSYPYFLTLSDAIERGQEDLLPGYVNMGSKMHVLTVPDKGIVIKIPNETVTQPKEHLEERLQVLERTRSLARVEQLVGYSLTEPHLVTGYIPGMSLLGLSQLRTNQIQERLRTVPDNHFQDVIETMQRLRSRAVTYDASPANVIHNSQGFHFVDNALVDANECGDKHVIEDVADFTAEILLHGVFPDVGLPEYVRRFHQACDRVLGSVAFAAVGEAILRVGFDDSL